MSKTELPHTEFNNWIAEQYGEIAGRIAESTTWWGSAIETIPRAGLILDLGDLMSKDDMASALAFYNGNQWPEDVLMVRSGPPAINGLPAIPSRPCLVVNRLPDLVRASLSKDGSIKLNPFQLLRLKALITRQNKDAQMLYNYLLSSLAEIVGNAKL